MFNWENSAENTLKIHRKQKYILKPKKKITFHYKVRHACNHILFVPHRLKKIKR